ncbi:P-loop containing nucleoside triphosphate hydrolase protein [Mycena maculata]|uniref:P-loop containing nucleoside triphosphate hydrolase protein n=1 Tax=Mycena maculata TaxID=230809 RepID=A0AAD7H8X2_9AGAR|nr:P-loop containing nucleoside triphosphate hydrolase protein [Mycena maculata]
MSPLLQKLVILGDGCCGKTSLFTVFVHGTFPGAYVPTLFGCHVADAIDIDGQPVALALYDTGGGEDYDRLRPLSYPETDVFLICFAVDNRNSLENVRQKWIPEVNHFCPDVPVLLVACKTDLHEDVRVFNVLQRRNRRTVTREEGMEVARGVGAHYYVECSAKLGEGVTEVFRGAAAACLRVGPSNLHAQRRRCVVL